MKDDGFSHGMTMEKYLDAVNRDCSAEKRKEIHRQLGQYILEGRCDYD